MLRPAAIAALAAHAQPAPAQTAAPAEVELELVLLADTTGSIDENELIFQRQGYASAITDPGVLAAIAGSAYGRIAVTYVEWAAADSQGVVVPWTIIDGAASAEKFARDLMLPPRMAYGRNAIGAALMKGKALIEGNDINGFRAVIDFSGDSANSWYGPPVADARAEVLAAGIVINGLAVLCSPCSGPTSDNLADRFRNEIIGGPGAFVVAADSRATFAEAVRKKLILEISGRPLLPELALNAISVPSGARR
jgi:hypothetical protein